MFCIQQCLAIALVVATPCIVSAGSSNDQTARSTESGDVILNAVRRGQIKAIDDPLFVPAAQSRLEETEPVIGVVIGGVARAYAISLLDRHELVNDRIGDRFFTVVWCPLARLVTVYDRLVGGETLTFGVSGMLVRNTVVLYDRQTDSLWSSVRHKAIRGQLKGTKLCVLAQHTVTTWGEWKAIYPDTEALSVDGRQSLPRSSYAGYYRNPKCGLNPVVNRRPGCSGKCEVYGISLAYGAACYPVDSISDGKLLSDSIGDTPVLLAGLPRSAGQVRAWRTDICGERLRFPERVTDGGKVVETSTTSVLDLETGRFIAGPLVGRRLEPLVVDRLYFFAWADFYPFTTARI